MSAKKTAVKTKSSQRERFKELLASDPKVRVEYQAYMAGYNLEVSELYGQTKLFIDGYGRRMRSAQAGSAL